MFKQKLFILAMGISLLGACNKTSNSNTNLVKASEAATMEAGLPDTVLGLFTGTLMGKTNGNQVANQFANATVSKKGNLVSISFSGGIPAVEAAFPSIQNLQFAPGEKNGLYDSIAGNGSVAGVHLAVYKTNLNIEKVGVGGTEIIYTGVKCDVAPEAPMCICVTNPNSPMCQK